LQRIKQRNREGEEGIPVDYLRKVHERHEEWLKTLKSIPILTIDTGIYDINNSKHQAEIRSLIQRFIEDLYG
jgi:deoxyadenosine/deoxycytidine kinase